MKIEIQVAKLNAVLKNVAKAIEARSISDWMCGVLLEATANGMLLATAMNTVETITQSAPCTVFEEGRVCLDGKLLINIAAKLSAEMCTITGDPESRKATICAKGSKTTVVMLNDSGFSGAMDDAENLISFQLPAKEWIEALKQVNYAIPAEISRPQLESANIRCDGMGIVNVCGMADNRMALCRLPMKDVAGSIDINIPKKTVGDMVSIFPMTNDALTIVTDGKHVTVSSDEIRIKSSLNAGEFTNYRRVIEAASPVTYATVSVKALKDAVARAMVVCESKNFILHADISKAGIGITAKGAIGDSHDLVECSFAGEPLEVAYNGRLLAEALAAISDENVVLRFTTSLTPTMLVPVSGDRWLHCVMPVRTFN